MLGSLGFSFLRASEGAHYGVLGVGGVAVPGERSLAGNFGFSRLGYAELGQRAGQAPSPLEQAQVAELQKLVPLFLESNRTCCYSMESVNQNARLLELKSVFYTAWNYRKRAVGHLLEREADEEARKRIAQTELDVRAQGGFGLRRSVCRLEDGDGKEFGIEIGAIRSQKVDSDGVGAMISTHSGTDRLIEFSDTLQTVAKALEEVAVKRAHAQDEAAQWKHKYEMELLRNAHLERLLANNAALDFSRRGDLSAMSNVETDADELTASNLSTQKPPNGSSLAKEITRNN